MPIALVLNRKSRVAVEESPSFAHVAERLRRSGDLQRAVSLCRDGLRIFPDHVSARVTLGLALVDLGQHAEARVELREALRRAPDNLAAIRGMAALHDHGDHDGDHEPWQEHEAETPVFPEVPAPLVAAAVAPAPPAAVSGSSRAGGALALDGQADAFSVSELSPELVHDLVESQWPEMDLPEPEPPAVAEMPLVADAPAAPVDPGHARYALERFLAQVRTRKLIMELPGRPQAPPSAGPPREEPASAGPG